MDHLIDVCLQIQLEQVKDIVGSFTNGTLDGPAKITYVSGKKTIANFKNGVYYGLRRDWSSDGTLNHVAFYNQYIMSPAWNLIGSYLIFSNAARIKFDDVSKNDIDFVLNMDTAEAYVGTLINPTLEDTVLDNLYEVELTESEPETMDCLPIPKWEIKSKADYLLLLESKKKVPLIPKDNCPFLLANTKGIVTVFQFWKALRSEANENDFGFLNLWKMKPEPSSPQRSLVKIPFISDINMVDYENQVFNLTIFNGKPAKFRMLVGGIDKNLNLHGTCHLATSKNQAKLVGTHPMLDWTPFEIKGKFIHGNLEGHVRIVTTNHNVIFATFKNGIMHGPVFVYGLSLLSHKHYEAKGFLLKNSENPLTSPGVQFQGLFKNGQAFGHFWIQMQGGGHLHGQVNSDGLISGNDIAYIYPDGQTALLGVFEDRIMKKAYHVNVEEYSCNDYGLLYVEKFSSKQSKDIFYFDPPTNVSFGGGGLMPDPYETKNLQLGKSSIPNSGDGVIARRDLPSGFTIIHYSLLTYKQFDEVSIYHSNCQNNKSRSDDERRACTKYEIELFSYRARISLPPELDKGPLPNLGPKVNHHFQFNNSEYDEIEHPRWGVIIGIRTTKPIKAGEEIFTHYGYKKNDFPADAPWYHAAQKKYLDDQTTLEQCNP